MPAMPDNFRNRFILWLTIAVFVAIPRSGATETATYDPLDLGRQQTVGIAEESTVPKQERVVHRRQREGTQVADRIGYFKMTGDRITFYTKDGQERYRGLENLALERVAQIISESQTHVRVQWRVSRIVTEFRGSNYLMITRALIKSSAAIPHGR